MTISTTRSRIRTIGSAALATSVGLGIGAVSVFAASPATAAAPTTPANATITYDCAVHIITSPGGNDSWFPGPDRSGTVPIVVDTSSAIPTSVTQGETIAPTPVTITLHMPDQLRGATDLLFGKYTRGGSTDTKVQFVSNAETQEVTLTGPSGTGPIADDWRIVKQDANSDGVTDPWDIPVSGQVPSVTVPATATGSITVNAPSSFSIQAEHSDNPTGTPIKSTTEVLCAQAAGQNLVLGEIPISGTAPLVTTTLTGTAAPSAVNADAQVAVSVAPTSATGTVKLTYQGKQVGTATLANGAAVISVPAATLPTVGSFVLNAVYAGDRGHKSDAADVTVVRTAAATPEPEVAKAKVGATAKGLKVGKKGSLAVTIKSDSADKSGKVTVKVGKKTLGKGKVNAKGKGKIKLKKITAKMVKKGKIKLTVIYAGNDTTAASKKNVKVKVKK